MNAFAEDVGVNIDGKNIVVTDTTGGFGSDKEFLDPSKLEKGIYILAVENTLSTRYTNVERIIGERLALQGFKIAESMEESSVAIAFSSNGALRLADADKAAANSALPNAQQLTANAGVAVTAIGMGIPGIVGFIAGGLFQTDSNLILSGSMYTKPVIYDGLFTKQIKSTVKNGDKFGILKVYYNLESGKEASDDIVLKMAVDQWINRYMKKPAVVVSEAASAK